MISCLLVRVARDPRGLPISNEIAITGESIDIGRGTACRIQLPDHRVNLRHATIRPAGSGALQIEAEADALLNIDGFIERGGLLHPGTQIDIGPYRLTVGSTTDGVDIVLSIALRESPATAADDPQSAPLTLADLGFSKRRLGVGLAVFILLAMLILPMLPRTSSAIEKWQAGLPLPVSEWLNPGPLSTGHAMFGAKCSTCHQQALRGVADAACSQCHDAMPGHLAAKATPASMPGETRCADCHPAHGGKADATKNGSAQCLACHKTRGAALAEVRDFAGAHPPFRLAVSDGKRVVLIRPDAKDAPRENSGLKFSHASHLKKEGVSTPDGDTVLTCRSCHKLEDGGRHFAPMTMATTCQQSRCHKQRFAEPLAGIIPHRTEREAMAIIRRFYVNELADAPAAHAKACAAAAKTGNAVRRTLDCADELAREYAAATLFKGAGENLQCAVCHEIAATESKDSPWKVAAVRLNRDWQPSATFAHARHETIACTDCHDKAGSKLSADVAFPRIEKCRECHVGSYGATDKVRSDCEDCHRFHRHPKALA